ncbi:putative reverse transcriptase domain-containing protein [Tanacetum coccineum]
MKVTMAWRCRDSKEEEFEEEEEPYEEEDDMEVDIKGDKNEPELTYPYEEVDPLNPPPLASKSEPKDVIEDSDGLLHGLTRRDINSLFGRMASLSRRLCGRETAHALVEKKGKAKDEYYGKLILDLGNEVHSNNGCNGKAGVEEPMKAGNVEVRAECKDFEERNLKKQDSEPIVIKSDPILFLTFVLVRRVPSSEAARISALVEQFRIMPPKSAPLTQAAIHRMIKENVDAAIATEWARHVNAGNDAKGSGPVRGQDAAPIVRECTFAGFMKCNPTAFYGTEGVWNAKVATMGLKTVNQMPWIKMKQLMTAGFCPIEEVQRMEHELWNLKVKEYNIMAYTQRFNELAFMCPRMVKPERVKVDAYIRGLTDNIKGEVTSSKPANLNEVVCMAHKLMEQKLQARDERILEGKKRKWESFQSGNSSGKGYHRDNSRQTL